MLEIGTSLVSFGTEYLVFRFANQNYKYYDTQQYCASCLVTDKGEASPLQDGKAQNPGV